MRWALGIEYAGTAYCGWQKQHHSPSVQEEVELALGQIANEQIAITCAGRTDTGVHAREQVIHFDTLVQRNERSWMQGGNTKLPPDISIKWARSVSEDFHARFGARARRYRYVIQNSSSRPAVMANRVTWIHQSLDHQLMHDAAQVLCGTHDFSSFRAVACQAKHPNRDLHEIKVSRQGEFVYIDIKANAFLHHMVRNISGVLIAIGVGKQGEGWVSELLELRDRTKGGVTAPPTGLYFVKVDYPEQYDLPHEVPYPSFY